jgi:hypothetical protein
METDASFLESPLHSPASLSEDFEMSDKSGHVHAISESLSVTAQRSFGWVGRGCEGYLYRGVFGACYCATCVMELFASFGLKKE